MSCISKPRGDSRDCLHGEILKRWRGHCRRELSCINWPDTVSRCGLLGRIVKGGVGCCLA